MLRCNAEHRGTHTNARIERNDLAVRHFLGETVHQVNFGTHGPLRTRGRSGNRTNDALCRADLIRRLRNLEAALRVRDYVNAGMLATHMLDMLLRESLVDGAIAFPQNHTSSANRFG